MTVFVLAKYGSCTRLVVRSVCDIFSMSVCHFCTCVHVCVSECVRAYLYQLHVCWHPQNLVATNLVSLVMMVYSSCMFRLSVYYVQ